MHAPENTPSNTLAAVADLVGRLPGITVLQHELAGSNAMLRVVARGGNVVECMQRLAMETNVAIEPIARSPEADIQLEQVLTAGTEPVDHLASGNLQMLGIHVVWRLHRLGRMADSDANAYLAAWGATPVRV